MVFDDAHKMIKSFYEVRIVKILFSVYISHISVIKDLLFFVHLSIYSKKYRNEICRCKMVSNAKHYLSWWCHNNIPSPAPTAKRNIVKNHKKHCIILFQTVFNQTILWYALSQIQYAIRRFRMLNSMFRYFKNRSCLKLLTPSFTNYKNSIKTYRG